MAKFFEKPKHRVYNVKPVFWDPEKEESIEREKRVKAKLGLNEDDERFIPNLKGKFKAEMQDRLGARQAGRRNSTVRLFFILVILLLAAYYIVFKYVDIF